VAAELLEHWRRRGCGCDCECVLPGQRPGWSVDCDYARGDWGAGRRSGERRAGVFVQAGDATLGKLFFDNASAEGGTTLVCGTPPLPLKSRKVFKNNALALDFAFPVAELNANARWGPGMLLLWFYYIGVVKWSIPPLSGFVIPRGVRENPGHRGLRRQR